MIPLGFLPLIGIFVAAIGSLVGLGGGFILVPILLFLFPEYSASTITCISLLVVFINATSSSLRNLRSGVGDTRTAIIMVIFALPAASLGSYTTRFIERATFDPFFGLLLVLGAIYILIKRDPGTKDTTNDIKNNRHIQEKNGSTYDFYVNEKLAATISPAVGFVSSFFGIGGGVIHVPSLVYLIRVPTRVATSTSLLLLVPTSFVGVLTHISTGQFEGEWIIPILLGIGASIGGQIGSYLSKVTNQKTVLLILAFVLMLVGARQILDTLI